MEMRQMTRLNKQVWAVVALVGVVLLPLPGATQEKFLLPPASTAPRGTAADFGGSWALKTVQNAHFDLALRVDNGDRVVGRFLNSANSKYDGTLTGTAKNGRLSFDWVQPAMDRGKGTGVIYVHTDNTLSGGITYKAPGAKQATYYRWHATRKSRRSGP
jgi:hypothetical protein